MKTDTTPFQNLKPEAILDAVENVGFSCDGGLIVLNSYENRVYQVGISESSPLIVKFYRNGRWSDEEISEEHAFTRELTELEIPAIEPWKNDQGTTLHKYNGYRFALYRRLAGRAPNFEILENLTQLGRLTGRIHAIGVLRPFKHRPTLDLHTFGTASREYLLKSGMLPGYLLDSYNILTDALFQKMERCFDQAGEVSTIRLHGDCHSGNILSTDDGFYFVDFDDSRMGPAIQDIWMCFSGSIAEREEQLAAFIEGYEQFYDFNARELYLIETLRTLRMIHHAAWLARRWDDPAFPIAFPWFADPKYWDEHIIGLQEQLALLDEAPLKLF